jgi:NAD(P)-dependent dehydrogenase (short-subunit alcohol dehydrogenase family)
LRVRRTVLRTKNVLTTACSSGFGRATAKHFLERGRNVVATMRTPQNALNLPKSERLRLLRLDVTDRRSTTDAIRDAIAAFGGLEVVVNNTGIGLFAVVTEALSYELSSFGVRAKLVESGYGPTTSFSANGSEGMNGLLPEAYAPYAEPLFQGLAASKSTTELDVASAVCLAATDGSKRLRYPAGADAEELAAMRRALPGEGYLEQMRAVVGPKADA